MKALHQLIHSLTPAEKDILRNYLQCFSRFSNSTETRTLVLAEYLMGKDQPPSDKEASHAIYKCGPDSRFGRLCQRLRNKVLECSVMDINIDRNEMLDEADLAIIRIRKKTSQFHKLYYTNSSYEMVNQLLDEIITQSKEYEYYIGVIEHLRYKSYRIGFRKGEKVFEKINDEVEKYERCYAVVNRSISLYHRLVMMYNFQGNENYGKVNKFISDSIKELKSNYFESKSPVALYYIKFFELDWFMNQTKYVRARRVCLDMLDLIRNNKSVYRKQRLGTVYLNLNACELYLGNYKQAGLSAKYAKENFFKNSANYYIALEQEFFALFYDGKYEEAEKVSGELMQSAAAEVGEFRHSKYCYMRAAALFRLGNCQAALNQFSGRMEISKDKAGWELGIRILSLMCNIELLNFDQAASQVNSLKVFISRQRKRSPIGQRERVISQLLDSLSRTGFVFTRLNGNTDKQMSELCSKEKPLRWEVLSPELIPFHLWMAGKMRWRKEKVKVKGKSRKKEKVRV